MFILQKIILLNLIIYFEFLYNIYFIYYIYDISFKFSAIIIKSKARIILFVFTNVTLKYTFLNSFNHNEATCSIEVSLFYHYFSPYIQNYYIRINFANTLEPIKFSENFPGKKNDDEKPRTVVGFLATIKLSSNDRFPSTNTITKKNFQSFTNNLNIKSSVQ